MRTINYFLTLHTMQLYTMSARKILDEYYELCKYITDDELKMIYDEKYILGSDNNYEQFINFLKSKIEKINCILLTKDNDIRRE